MNITRRKGAVVLGGMSLLVIAGAVTWSEFYATERAQPGDELRIVGADKDDVEALRQRLARMKDLNAELRRRITEYQSELSRRALEPDSGASTAAVDGTAARTAPPAGHELRFTHETYQEALDAVDWVLLGNALKNMSALMVELMEAIEKGENIPPELQSLINRLKADVLSQAGPLIEAKMRGQGGNGAFSHPLVAANCIDAALTAAKLPLNPDQVAHMQAITKHYVAQDESLRILAESRDPKNALLLEGLLAEMNMKRAFFEEVRAVLTEGQQRLLFPTEVRDVNRIEMFGVGGDWGKFTRVVVTQGPKDFASIMTTAFQSSLGMSEKATTQLGNVMQKWVQTYPPEYWAQKGSKNQRRGYMRIDRIHMAAQKEADLFRRILKHVELTDEQRLVLLRSRNVLVPIPR